MKKALKFLSVILLVLTIALLATACNGDNDNGAEDDVPPEVETTFYTVTFDSAGGSAILPISIESGKTVTKPSSPTKKGYEFLGWRESGGTEFDFSRAITSDTTLFAVYKPINYDITYETNGGNDMLASVYTVETESFSPGTPERAGYEFSGWYFDLELTAPCSEIAKGSVGDITLYAKWSAATYEIKYSLEGGENNPNNPAEYTVESESILLKEPTRKGYNFLGWYESGSDTAISQILKGSYGTVSVYAKWSAEKYGIIYVLNGGENHADNPSVFTYGDATVNLLQPSRKGYDFGGWYADDQLTESVSAILTNVDASVTVYAKWTPTVYNVSYELFGGENASDNPLTYSYEDGRVTLLEPTKRGYSFLGWYTDAGFGKAVSSISEPTEDVTLYAKWARKTYDITYHTNGGALEGSTDSYHCESEYVSFANPHKYGYTFLGWYTSSDFLAESALSGIETGSVGDVVVYAKWELSKYTVHYETNGGRFTSTAPSEFNINSPELVFPTPEKAGYRFDGWYSDSGFSQGSEKASVATGSSDCDVYVYAKWTEIIYTLTYYYNDGVSQPSKIYFSVNSEFALTAPERSHYEFLGWFNDEGFTEPIEKIEKGTTEDVDVFASWEAIKFPITYHYNGADEECDNPDYYTVNDAAFTLAEPTKSGEYSFIGWYEASDFSGNPITEIDPSRAAPLTLYAKWLYVYSYTIDENGNATITHYNGNETAITIPQTVEGYPVIALDSFVFDSGNRITSITIGEHITRIASGALSYCMSLECLTVPFVGTESGGEMMRLFYANEHLEGAPTTLKTITVTDGDEIPDDAFSFFSYTERISVPSGVSSIGSSAFRGCSSLKEFSIPESVTSIGTYAFYGCSSLTNISLPDGISVIDANTFSGCTSLKTVSIGEGITKIGKYAFCETAITTLDFLDGVKEIGFAAFLDCTSLTTAKLPDSLELIDCCVLRGCSSLNYVEIPFVGRALNDESDCSKFEHLFGCLYAQNEIPESLKHVKINGGIIGEDSFSYLTFIESVTLPPNTTEIGDNAFNNCSSLKKITVPEGVKRIGSYAFAFCSALNDVTLPESLEYIGSDAFYSTSTERLHLSDIASFAAITFTSPSSNPMYEGGAVIYLGGVPQNDLALPDGMTTINSYAFAGADWIKTVSIPESVTFVGEAAFYRCNGIQNMTVYFFGQSREDTQNKTLMHYFGDTYEFPETSVTVKGVEAIPAYAFSYLPITAISLDGSLKSIGDGAFLGCTNIRSLVIPDSVTYIGEFAFSDCQSIESAIIGSGVLSMGRGIFNGCNGLTSLSIPFVGETADRSTTNTQFGFIFINEYVDSGHNSWIPEKLKSVSITTASAIPDNAFANCIYIERVSLSASVTKIGTAAFRACIELTSINVSGITSLGEEAFASCQSLSSVILNPSLSIVPTAAFRDCYSLSEITVPHGVTEIQSYAFYGCNSLERVSIADSVETVGYQAFGSCASLESFRFGNGVKVIGDETLVACSSLKTVYIPSSVLYIGRDQFYESAVSTIHYAGSKSEWDSIDIDSSNGWEWSELVTILYNSYSA